MLGKLLRTRCEKPTSMGSERGGACEHSPDVYARMLLSATIDMTVADLEHHNDCRRWLLAVLNQGDQGENLIPPSLILIPIATQSRLREEPVDAAQILTTPPLGPIPPLSGKQARSGWQ